MQTRFFLTDSTIACKNSVALVYLIYRTLLGTQRVIEVYLKSNKMLLEQIYPIRLLKIEI